MATFTLVAGTACCADGSFLSPQEAKERTSSDKNNDL
jgi:hypothetical protein